MVNKNWAVLFVGMMLYASTSGHPTVQDQVIVQHSVPMQSRYVPGQGQVVVPPYFSVPLQYNPITGEIYNLPIGYTSILPQNGLVYYPPQANNQAGELFNLQTGPVNQEDFTNLTPNTPEATEYDSNSDEQSGQLQQRQNAAFVETHRANNALPATNTNQLRQASALHPVKVPNVQSRLGHLSNVDGEQEKFGQQQNSTPRLTTESSASISTDGKQTEQQQLQARPTRPSNIMSMLPHKVSKIDFRPMLEQLRTNLQQKMESEQHIGAAAESREEAHFMGMTSNNQREKLTYAVDSS